MQHADYYGLLQISPRAEPETIHRVYRFLAARFHPDNHQTGNAEKFFLLKQAYDVLSDPPRRAAYDASRRASQPPPLSTWIDFMDSMEGELNRRLALLAVLYFQRRINPYHPEVPFRDIERRLGFPRDYLEFTAWYLRQKGYITRGDNSDFTLTAVGVDFVEKERVNIPVLNKLLTDGDASAGSEATATMAKTLTPSGVPSYSPDDDTSEDSETAYAEMEDEPH
jgi:curved DNA-binding protein